MSLVRPLRFEPFVFGILGLLGACTSSQTLAPFSIEMRSPQAGEGVEAGYRNFQFFLKADNAGAPLVIGAADLFLNYEKKLHAFVFDEALEEFQHLHPEESALEAGLWEMSLLLNRQGKYQFWVDGLVRGANTEVLLTGVDFEVTSGGLGANTVPSSLTPVSQAAEGISQVEVEWLKGPSIGASNQLKLRFSRTDQTSPEIQDYLGASAHVTGARLGGGALVHIHGMEIKENGQPVVYLEGILSQSGDYRLWVQFIDGGALRTVPLAFRLDP